MSLSPRYCLSQVSRLNTKFPNIPEESSSFVINIFVIFKHPFSFHKLLSPVSYGSSLTIADLEPAPAILSALASHFLKIHSCLSRIKSVKLVKVNPILLLKLTDDVHSSLSLLAIFLHSFIVESASKNIFMVISWSSLMLM